MMSAPVNAAPQPEKVQVSEVEKTTQENAEEAPQSTKKSVFSKKK